MSQTDSLLGQQIASYKISSHLARGGMADVYIADDLGLRRQVVLKIMLPHLGQNKAFVTRFQREARTTARLNHPNIIQVYKTGLTGDGRPYLAMQYIRGDTLHENLLFLAGKGQLLPVDRTLTLTGQIAKALNVAHRAGIVHHDLKHSNILLQTNGMPVVTDLGIAADESTTRLTQSGEVMGTPFYMSPEQAQSKPLDGRSDIHSLGVILYEILAGDPPFRANSPLAVLHQHIYDPPPLLLSSRDDLASITSQVVEICLRKDPEKRFQDAGQLETALDTALATETGVMTSATTSTLAATVIEPFLSHQQATIPFHRTQPKTSNGWRWPLLVPFAAILLLAILFGGQRLLGIGDNQPHNTIEGNIHLPVPTDAAGNPVGKVENPTVSLVILIPTIQDPTAMTEPPKAKLADIIRIPAELPLLPLSCNQIVFQSNRDGDHEIYIMEQNGADQRQLTSNSFADNYPGILPRRESDTLSVFHKQGS